MSEFLIVRLSSQREVPISWWIGSNQHQDVLASGELSDETQFSQLTSQAEQRTVIVLLAASDVVLSEVAIPKGSARQLESMLPYLLEDELAQEAETLHWTLLAREGASAFVCGVDRAWLKGQLDALRACSMNVTKVLPDVLAVPLNEAEMRAIPFGAQWLVRKGEYQGISLAADWLPLLVDSAWAQRDGQTLPLRVESEAPLDWLAAHSETLDWRSETLQPVMPRLTQQAILSKVNLLSGEFKPQSSWLAVWRIWRPAAVAAGVLCAAVIAHALLLTQHYTAQAQQYRAESERIVRTLLPERSKIPTTSYLQRLLNQEEQRLAGGNTDSALLVMVDKLASSLVTKSGVTIQALAYDGSRDEVRLQIQAQDFSALEQISAQLARQFQVEQGQVTRANNIVNGTFVLKPQ